MVRGPALPVVVAATLVVVVAPALGSQGGWVFGGLEGTHPTYVAMARGAGAADATLDAVVAGGSKVVAIDGDTGAARWTRNLTGPVRMVRTLDLDGDGAPQVFVTTSDALGTAPRHSVHALDPADGTIAGCVSVEGAAGTLDAADLNGDGTKDVVLATPGRPTGAGPVGAALLADRVEALDGRLWGSPYTGACLPFPQHEDVALPLPWHHWVAPTEASPAGYDALALGDVTGDSVPDVVVAEFFGSRVHAFDGRSGSPLWAFSADDEDTGGVAVGPGGAEAYVVTGKGSTVTALHGATGQTRWFSTHGDGAKVAIFVAGGTPRVAVGGPDHLAVLDLATGAEVWRLDTARLGFSFQPRHLVVADVLGDAAPELVASMHRGGPNVYDIRNPGALLVVDAARGVVLATSELPHVALRLATQPGGTTAAPQLVAAPYEDGIVRAFRI